MSDLAQLGMGQPAICPHFDFEASGDRCHAVLCGASTKIAFAQFVLDECPSIQRKQAAVAVWLQKQYKTLVCESTAWCLRRVDGTQGKMWMCAQCSTSSNACVAMRYYKNASAVASDCTRLFLTHSCKSGKKTTPITSDALRPVRASVLRRCCFCAVHTELCIFDYCAARRSAIATSHPRLCPLPFGLVDFEFHIGNHSRFHLETKERRQCVRR